jgi:predicted O-linked N-acetylglucosamine transferase (SPINDLY family)
MGTPSTGQTTMADVLSVGVPGVTLTGESFASRVAGSLLRNLGMEELVTEERTSYERLAVELATDSGRLAELSRRLKTRAQEGGVFDTQAFTMDMEAACRKMWAGLEPERIG